MNIYLLSQDEVDGYDTFDSCVVCAETEEDAKTITPYGYAFEDDISNTWAKNISAIKCEEIGIANSNKKRGVIIASFNAG